ncbi:MAG: hypothetical protein AAGA30_19315 [Planctomycetota bacterium]
MAFFGKSLRSRKIEINEASIDARSPDMLKRLDRIENNFERLNEILDNLETQFELDDRLVVDANDSPSQKLRTKKPR